MVKNNDSNDLIEALSDLSDGINKIDNAMDGKIIIEKGQFVDSSIPIELNRLSSDRKAAINEADYLNARKNNQLSEKHVKRIARDYIEENSNNIIQIDSEE